jgi:hypothetical protein
MQLNKLQLNLYMDIFVTDATVLTLYICITTGYHTQG